jgi:hypothetical protein
MHPSIYSETHCSASRAWRRSHTHSGITCTITPSGRRPSATRAHLMAGSQVSAVSFLLSARVSQVSPHSLTFEECALSQSFRHPAGRGPSATKGSFMAPSQVNGNPHLCHTALCFPVATTPCGIQPPAGMPDGLWKCDQLRVPFTSCCNDRSSQGWKVRVQRFGSADRGSYMQFKAEQRPICARISCC